MTQNRKGFIGLVLMVGLLVALGIGLYIGSLKKAENAGTKGSAPGELTLEVLKNSEYSYSGDTIKLVNGTHALKPLSSKDAPEDYYVKLNPDFIIYSDVNGDGVDDALVILESRLGGPGVFKNLDVVLNENGKARDAATAYLGDRVEIKSLEASENVITVTTIPRDSEVVTIKKYTFQNNELTVQK